MRKINRTYKFRLYPNKEQTELLAKHFGLNHTSAGTADYTGGEEIRTDHMVSHPSMKPEAHEPLAQG